MAEATVNIPVGECRLCPFRNKTLLAGLCIPADICVFVESGRQIDRFFRLNPEYAVQYLKDPFWERRAIAARYAPIKFLNDLINDEDEVVRRVIAYRLPPQQITCFINDPDREVRMTIADRIEFSHLEKLATDPITLCV